MSSRGIVVKIPACHAGDPGSIPDWDNVFFLQTLILQVQSKLLSFYFFLYIKLILNYNFQMKTLKLTFNFYIVLHIKLILIYNFQMKTLKLILYFSHFIFLILLFLTNININTILKN